MVDMDFLLYLEKQHVRHIKKFMNLFLKIMGLRLYFLIILLTVFLQKKEGGHIAYSLKRKSINWIFINGKMNLKLCISENILLVEELQIRGEIHALIEILVLLPALKNL